MGTKSVLGKVYARGCGGGLATRGSFWDSLELGIALLSHHGDSRALCLL